MIYKLCWAVRFCLLAPFFGSFGFPSYIGKPVFLMGVGKAFLGKKVRIFPGLRLEVHNGGRLVVGDNVSIGQNFHVTCAGSVIIGKGTLITGEVMITDIDHRYKSIGMPVLEQGRDVRPTEIGKHCFIGMGAKIQAGTRLGDHCIVGANSVVRGDFEGGSVIVGVPGRVLKKYNHSIQEWAS
jgi:acetyltransferase-like isoleucine patch superfamily enzyme